MRLDAPPALKPAASLGFTSKQTALLSVPGGVISILAILAAALLAGRLDQRALLLCTSLALTMVGGALLAFLPGNAKAGKLVPHPIITVFMYYYTDK